MVKTGLVIFFSLFTIIACENPSNYSRAEDAQDAGREFIRASLDGNYDKAKFYLLKDSANLMLFEKWKSGYDKLSTEDRVSYKNANILPLKIENTNDSVISYIFTNSFKNKDTTTIRVIRVNGEWLVDFKDIH